MAMAAQSDILICLLPLTPETRGVLNAKLLATLPRGAYVINGARGGHMVAEDMLAALDSDILRALPWMFSNLSLCRRKAASGPTPRFS